MAGEDPQSAVAGCQLDPSNKQTTFQKSGYQWRHTTRSGRRKGPPRSQSFPTSAFRRRVTSQSALRDHPSGSSFNTDLDSRMGMKRIQPSDDFDQRVQFTYTYRCFYHGGIAGAIEILQRMVASGDSRPGRAALGSCESESWRSGTLRSRRRSRDAGFRAGRYCAAAKGYGWGQRPNSWTESSTFSHAGRLGTFSM